MQTVISVDGTRIAYETDGDGPPLVLLHGSPEMRDSWRALRTHLADRFRLIVPDRRGHGESGDADDYTLSREIEDLRALDAAIDGKLSVFGHSFGAVVALAAAVDIPLDRLVVYEPPVVAGEYHENLTEELRTLVSDGNRQQAMKRFYQEAAGIPAPEQLPIWPEGVRFELLETIIRERAAAEAFDATVAGEVETETLLVTGEHSPPHLRAAVRTLDEQLPQSHRVELDEVGHVGTQTAPERVASTVHHFWDNQS